MNKEPFISIIIPVYNGSDYVAEAIESALAQTYPSFEVLVINDGSKDDGRTEKICLSFGDRIRYYAQPNGGVSSALNTGIERAKGELICWLSHDDLYLKDRLATQVARLRNMKDPYHTILYGNYDIMDERGVVYDHIRNPPTPIHSFYEALISKSVYVSTFQGKNFVLNGCTLMIPHQAFDDAGRFNEKLRTTQDYEMWFRLCQKYDFVQMDEVLLLSRRHAKQGTITLWKTMRSESEEITLKALGLYAMGDPKTDLNLARTAFSLRTNLGNSQASRELIRMALDLPKKTLIDSIFIVMAMGWNVAFTYAKIAYRLMRYEVRRKRAYRELHIEP